MEREFFKLDSAAAAQFLTGLWQMTKNKHSHLVSQSVSGSVSLSLRLVHSQASLIRTSIQAHITKSEFITQSRFASIHNSELPVL